jgi:hypothetical protein
VYIRAVLTQIVSILELVCSRLIPDTLPIYLDGRESERIFCLLDVELRDFCGRRLGPRTYTFPFSIALPEALPSSTRFKTNDVNLAVQVSPFPIVGRMTNSRRTTAWMGMSYI